MRGADGRERVGRAAAHLAGDRSVAKDAVGDQERRQDRGLGGDAPLVVALDEPLVEIGRHDRQLRLQVGDRPAAAPEHAHGRRAVGRRERPRIVRQQADEDRLARAVRPENGGVLAGPYRQPQPIEHAPVVLDDGRIHQLEDRVFAHAGHSIRDSSTAPKTEDQDLRPETPRQTRDPRLY